MPRCTKERRYIIKFQLRDSRSRYKRSTCYLHWTGICLISLSYMWGTYHVTNRNVIYRYQVLQNLEIKLSLRMNVRFWENSIIWVQFIVSVRAASVKIDQTVNVLYGFLINFFFSSIFYPERIFFLHLTHCRHLC